MCIGYDVAQVFMNAITHRNVSLGESFDAEAENSITLYGYAKHLYEFFGHEPKINSWVGTSGVNTKETKKNVSILIIILYVVEHLALKRKKDY